MKSRLLRKLELKNPVLIASLPDMGGVGGIASKYLAEKLGAPLFAEIVSHEKPWVNYFGGVATLSNVVYKMYAHPQSDLIVFTGEKQPESTQTLYELCNEVIRTAGLIAPIKRIYTLGGSNSRPDELRSTVNGCANRLELVDELRKHRIPVLGREIGTITWFNGVILGVAHEEGIDGIGLYAEVEDPKVPQPLAVRNLLGVLITMGVIPEIDLGELEEEHHKIQKTFQ